MGVLLPLWGMIVPFCMGLFVSQLMIHGTLLPWTSLALILGGFVLLPLLAILATAVCEDDRLLVSKEGIAFPLMLLPGLGFRRERLWSDLAAVDLNWDGTSQYSADDRIWLNFGEGRASMSLNNISKPDLEQLLLAVEVWGAHARKPPALSDFQQMVQNETKGLEHISYMQMWEEEMSRRFSATSFVPLEPGRELKGGHLKIVRQLAFGGLSAIYLAQSDGRDLVVLKEAVVPASADDAAREKAAELFDREARFLARLRHGRIASVLDHFVEGGRNYLLLEYIQGQDLRQLVKQHGAQSPAKVRAWAAQIAELLDYLHGQDPPIIHRDLTPDNLVLREDGCVVLIDFGAANEFVGTATGTLVGKQAYIAPEQFRGKARVASDIYALGGTLYFLVTGADPEALMPCRPSDVVAEVPEALDDLIYQCMSMEPGERPAAKEVIARTQAGGVPAATSGEGTR